MEKKLLVSLNRQGWLTEKGTVLKKLNYEIVYYTCLSLKSVKTISY